MSFKRRNPNRMFDRGEKQNQIEMIQFLGRLFVVQAKRKVKGMMHYDIIGATGTDIDGIRFVNVPHDTLVLHKSTSDEETFGNVSKRFQRLV